MKGCFLCCLLWIQFAYGQSSKTNIDLYIQLQETPVLQQNTTYVHALVQGDLHYIAQAIELDNQAQYKYGIKDIASVYVSLATIKQLTKSPYIRRIEVKKAVMHQLTHTEDSAMLTNNNAWAAHAGGGVLPQGYQGEGVLLGMIDDGIEWLHPDFRTADNRTRIMKLWDQSSTDRNYFESYFGYGASWDSSAINIYQCSHQAGDHGSHVLGTAGGNGLASGKFVGIAPQADLAVVNVQNTDFLSSFVDGLHYLFREADRTGQACVVNSSVGSYTSGHDSKDLYAQLIANMLDAKVGRALVQAGGNARAYAMHLQANLQNSTTKTWFAKTANSYYTHFSMFADTADFHQVDFSLQLLDASTQQQLAQTAIYNVLKDFSFSNQQVAQQQQVIFYDNNGQPVTLDIFVDQYADAYEVYIRIGSVVDYGIWQLTTTGTGKYDVWSHPELTGTSRMLKNTTLSTYQNPDSLQSIVGYWTTLPQVVTVGAYQNRDYHVNYNGDTAYLGTAGFPKLGIAAFSSLGPTRTGLQKPDITAPGGQVLSAFSISTLQAYRQTNNTRLNEDGWHATNRGTSMSAPMVAGAIALYLQCKPYANTTDIQRALRESARVDSFVFVQGLQLPNKDWGHGKLDVYELVKSCLIYGCVDSLAANYNPLATVADSSCGYVISPQNVLRNKQKSLICSPNPTANNLLIQYQLQLANNSAKLQIYNAIGQVVYHQVLTQKQGSISWQKSDLPTGSYFVVLTEKGEPNQVQQVIVLE